MAQAWGPSYPRVQPESILGVSMLLGLLPTCVPFPGASPSPTVSLPLGPPVLGHPLPLGTPPQVTPPHPGHPLPPGSPSPGSPLHTQVTPSRVTLPPGSPSPRSPPPTCVPRLPRSPLHTQVPSPGSPPPQPSAPPVTPEFPSSALTHDSHMHIYHFTLEHIPLTHACTHTCTGRMPSGTHSLTSMCSPPHTHHAWPPGSAVSLAPWALPPRRSGWQQGSP